MANPNDIRFFREKHNIVMDEQSYCQRLVFNVGNKRMVLDEVDFGRLSNQEMCDKLSEKFL